MVMHKHCVAYDLVSPILIADDVKMDSKKVNNKHSEAGKRSRPISTTDRANVDNNKMCIFGNYEVKN